MAELELKTRSAPVKTCKRCGEEKSVEEFHIRRERGVPRAECKACYRAAVTARRDPEDNRRRVKEWIRANPEKHLAHGRQSYKRARQDLTKSLGYLLRSKRAYCKKSDIPFTITVHDIVALYHAQDGRCGLTGRRLLWGRKGMRRDTLSIDRIDGALGYVPGNIRLLTYQANFARNQFSDEELFEFCCAVLSTNIANG